MIGKKYVTKDDEEAFARKLVRRIRGSSISGGGSPSSGGGSPAFTDLTDTPSSYAGEGLKGVRVNAAEDALEFFDVDLNSLSDVDLESAHVPIDGDVLMFDSASGRWIPSPCACGGSGGSGGGATDLCDLLDVFCDSPYIPADGDVLTYDGSSGLWIPLAPTGGALSLDDLLDVDAPAPFDGDFLSWDAVAGAWINVPPPSPGSGASGSGGGSGRDFWNPDIFPDSPTIQSDHFDDGSLAAKWSEFDPGGVLTVSESGHHAYLEIANGVGVMAAIFQDLPSGDFTITAKAAYQIKSLDSAYLYAGIMLFEDATNNPSTCKLLNFTAYFKDGYLVPQIIYNTDYNSWSASPYTGLSQVVSVPPSVYFRVRRTGTNLYFDTSLDGVTWKYWATIAQGTYFTPAEFGIGGWNGYSTNQKIVYDWIYYHDSDVFISPVGATLYEGEGEPYTGYCLVEDDFNRADSGTVGEASVAGGYPATIRNGGAAGDWGITSNELAPKSSLAEHYVIWNTGMTRYKMTATLGSVVSGELGIIIRFSQDSYVTNGAFLLIHCNPTGGHYQLYRYVGYGYTLLEDSAISFAASDVVVITDTGTCLTVTVNGSALWTNILYHWALGGTGVGFRCNSSTNPRIAGIKVEMIP